MYRVADTDLPQQRTNMNTNELYRLAELGKTSGGFLHDMVNHVTAVTLSMNYLEERATHDSKLLREYAEQTARIRKSIEEFARGVRGYMKGDRVHCFFTPAVELCNLVELFRCRVDTKNIVITTKFDNRLRLYGNRLRFGQIISNILSNAVDALRTIPESEKRTISLSCEKAGQFIKITISDSGPGIPAHTKKHLFEPFVSTKESRGTGLGLVSAKKIIEQDFSGRIELETVLGGGSTFSLFFRRQIGGPTPPPAHISSQKTPSK